MEKEVTQHDEVYTDLKKESNSAKPKDIRKQTGIKEAWIPLSSAIVSAFFYMTFSKTLDAPSRFPKGRRDFFVPVFYIYSSVRTCYNR